jgi:indole-3-glycerol phosphate synthase
MKSTFLQKILEIKKQRVEAIKRETDFASLRGRAEQVRADSKPHRLGEVLRRENQMNVIAEIKRASPSKGIINDKIDVAETAKSYESGGACAVSVLTEEDFFAGSLSDLETVRSSVALPILRKDFIYDEFQIYEAAANGADAVLLIAAMLNDKDLLNLYRLAEIKLGLDVLLEVHTFEELERAGKIGAKIVGVNNRDLHSFVVSLDVSRQLIKRAPAAVLLVAESGLRTREDLFELRDLGYSGFLIGETLMKLSDAKKELRKLITDEHG